MSGRLLGQLKAGIHSKYFSRFLILTSYSDPFCLMQAKCQGKEHMIESEISILTAIDHPNIIQLEEVFDFPGEKYLVMEYVQVIHQPTDFFICNIRQIQGGDLFDAIATDIKYTEGVARDMIHDLADALQVSLLLFSNMYQPCTFIYKFLSAQYLHDRMICHRDIKPENLLVIDRQTTKVATPQIAREQNDDQIPCAVVEAGRLWLSGGGSGAIVHGVRDPNLCCTGDPR